MAGRLSGHQPAAVDLIEIVAVLEGAPDEEVEGEPGFLTLRADIHRVKRASKPVAAPAPRRASPSRDVEVPHLAAAQAREAARLLMVQSVSEEHGAASVQRDLAPWVEMPRRPPP